MFIFALLGVLGAIVLAHCLVQLSRGRASRQWPSTNGTIGPRPISRRVAFPIPALLGRFFYTYRVGSSEFTGHRIWFGSDVATSIPNPAYTWLGESFPPEAVVAVYFNPANPAESVLKTGCSPGTYVLAFVGGTMALAGMAALWLSG